MGVVSLGDGLSTLGLDVTDPGDRSSEKRPFGREETESALSLGPLGTALLTRGVAGELFALGVPDKEDLYKHKSRLSGHIF